MPAMCAGASSAGYGGYRDWRVPTIKELVPFDGIDSWSATSSSANPANAMVFSMGDVRAASKSNDQDYHVLRCVRGGNLVSVYNLGDNGNVSVMKTSANFDAWNSDGTINYQTRKAVATEYFRTHADVDFLVFLSTFDYAMAEPNSSGFYLAVKNDIEGISQVFFDNSAEYGSPGNLQGTIDLGNVTALAADPYGPKLEGTVSMLSHELMHRFGSYVRFKNPDNSLNTALLGKNSAHWSYLLDSQGSVMFGNAWRDNGDGTFTSGSAMTGYSPLDLYLMGMIPKEQVPPMLLIDNPAIDKTKLPETGATITGTAKTVTIDDIIAAEGARIPDYTTSQKQFEVGFVLLSRPGDNTASAAAAIETLCNAWAGRFVELTQGKGSIANIPASLNLQVDSPLDNTTITRPDVPVSGTIINTTGAETGVTVNGIPATVTGNQFVVNHVPLQEGSNTLAITATDVNGLTATATRNVTAQAGHYIRITSNIESGTAPMNVSLRLDGSFTITDPQISVSGTATMDWLPPSSPTELAAAITSEGVIAFTASAIGPDGETYSDTVTITVLSKTQLENLLNGKWEGIKAKILAKDVEGAVSNFPTSSQAHYRELFTALGNRLPVLAENLPALKLGSATDSIAKTLLSRQETVLGQQKTVSYLIFFVKENGIWKLRQL